MIVIGALALAACSSTPDWLNLDSLKPAPMTDTVRFESEPPGAEAKTSTGQTCRTPCALALEVTAPVTVTFSLAGYQPESETIEPVVMTGSPAQLRPNPGVVELTPAPPPPKKLAPVKKKKKPAPKASSAKPQPTTVSQPMAPQQPAPSPWPAPQPQR